MRQPPGFEQGPPSLVCKLNKALYGLKQASRAWFSTITYVLLRLGFIQSRADPSLFHRRTKSDTTYLHLYVDDMLITGTSSTVIRHVDPTAQLSLLTQGFRGSGSLLGNQSITNCTRTASKSGYLHKRIID